MAAPSAFSTASHDFVNMWSLCGQCVVHLAVIQGRFGGIKAT